MYERSYGYRYDEVRDLTTTEIAKQIRVDIKTAVGEGLLPARWKYSVTTDHGTAINVNVRDCGDAWQTCDGRQVLTEEAAVAKMTLERIHGAYNHDGSEIRTDYFDVRYYGRVDFEDAREAAFRAKETERIAAKKQARATGSVVGKVANYGSRGRRVVHLLIETDEGRQVLGCGARVWRGSVFAKVDDDQPLTCSRCARRQ